MRTIQTAIADMLRENTGISICDSGGAYGRLWEQNQKVDSFEDRPVQTIEIGDVDDILVQYDIYYYLTDYLKVSEESETLTSGMYVDHDDISSGLELIERFLEEPNITPLTKVANSYNDDNVLSAVIQYALFEYETEYSCDQYIILQIHTGYDVRAGYTSPQIFMIDDIDYFIMAMYDVNASCQCDTYYSDNAGYTFYSDNHQTPKWIFDKSDETIVCQNCLHKVNFDVIQTY